MGISNKPLCAFYSETTARPGQDLIVFVDTSTGEFVRANLIAEEDDGMPGQMRKGEMLRPDHAETYVCLGEIGPGKLMRCETAADRKRGIVADPQRRAEWRRFTRDRPEAFLG